MRFRLAVAGVLAAGLAAPATASALNPQHAGLQVALRAQGLYDGPIDAIVGPRTVAAIRTFQRTHGLEVTGLADVRMRRALGPFGTPLFGARAISRGEFGWDVAVLQFLLVRRGIAVPVNGYVDGPTVRGIRRYQRGLHLAADGVAGRATFTALGLQTRIPVRAQPVSTRLYVVKPGDSLTLIARREHLTLSTLAHANRLNPSHVLLIGTKLRLPASVSSSATSATSVRSSLETWSSHFGVDPRLARALAWMESGYQNDVVSSVGAQGIMQLLPSTWKYVENVLIGHPVAHTADGNVEVGVALLHHLLGAFGGDERLALAAWYQGERSVRERGVYKVSKVFVSDVEALKTRM
ncbi:MAG: LysM peptidoglycan-binding domain-containing protein [Actinobacteria bacterium]|nr:MAG: LysM peptidoglycan-binding domain-containing protein [Actinomycetota bacterium]